MIDLSYNNTRPIFMFGLDGSGHFMSLILTSGSVTSPFSCVSANLCSSENDL